LVDCLNYQGLCHAQGRHAGPLPDRDEPVTCRMKLAQCNLYQKLVFAKNY